MTLQYLVLGADREISGEGGADGQLITKKIVQGKIVRKEIMKKCNH